MDWTAFLTVLGSATGVLIAWLTFGRAAKNQAKDDGAIAATIKADIGYIRNGIDEIKLEQKVLRTDLVEVQKTVYGLELKTNALHSRVDRMEEKHESE